MPRGEADDGGAERERAGARAGQRPQGQGHGARPAQDARRRQGPRRARRLHQRQARRRHRQRHVAPPSRRARAHAREIWHVFGIIKGRFFTSLFL